MNKLDQNTKNKLNSLWFIIAIICVVITYYCMKVSATNNYKTILQVAAKSSSTEVIKFLASEILNVSNASILGEIALHYAAEGGCLEVALFLIEEGVDVNATGGSTWTALHSAALVGNLEVVKFLLDKGANPNIKNEKGKVPRNMAERRVWHNANKLPYREIIKLLSDAEDTAQGKQ